MQTVRFIDLFAGLGGLRLGFERGFALQGVPTECVFTSEIKEYAKSAYSTYFNINSADIFGDITQISVEDIPGFDYLLAGFPCQPFSSAGSRKGFADTRGTLFFEIERILRSKIEKGCKAKGFLLENVEGLVNHDCGNTLRVILNNLRNLGYSVSFRVLDASHFGLAQRRKRIYIVGTDSFEPISFDDFEEHTCVLDNVLDYGLPVVDNTFTRSLLSYMSLSDLAGKSVCDKRGGANNIHSWDLGLRGLVTDTEKQLLNLILRERRKKLYSFELGLKRSCDGIPLTYVQICRFSLESIYNYDSDALQRDIESLVRKKYLKYKVIEGTSYSGYSFPTGVLSFEFTKILNFDDVAPTLVATDISRLGVIDRSSNGLRHLTVKECLRLCGYPEDYDLSYLPLKKAYDLIGNTVCVPVIQSVSVRLAQDYINSNLTY